MREKKTLDLNILHLAKTRTLNQINYGRTMRTYDSVALNLCICSIHFSKIEITRYLNIINL